MLSGTHSYTMVPSWAGTCRFDSHIHIQEMVPTIVAAYFLYPHILTGNAVRLLIQQSQLPAWQDPRCIIDIILLCVSRFFRMSYFISTAFTLCIR